MSVDDSTAWKRLTMNSTMLEREIISEAERDDLVKKIEEGPSEDEQ
jgi:hypothetical protein